MESRKLKLYTIGFSPITREGRVAPSRKVLVIAMSEDQARKFLRDWLINVKRMNYFFEGIEKINKTSKEGRDFIKPFTIMERYERQQKVIYGYE